MAEIHKKILPGFYEDLVSGKKKYEFRLNDDDLKDAKPGDVLVLHEWSGLGEERKPTGRVVKKKITYTGRFPLQMLEKFWPREEMEEKGFLIMSLED